ncbi:hypothetical protein ACET3Z_008259 [Daucus carota]
MALAHPTPLLFLSCLLTYVLSTMQAKNPVNYKPDPVPEFAMNNMLNVIDSCWRSNPNWASNREALADCAVGFGKSALGGKNGKLYVVVDSSDDAVDPKTGTLRYGVIQPDPLWIIFENDMVIKLENELIVNSYKTIDGRGARVEIAGGPCITLDGVNNVIIHGISIHDCKPGKAGLVRSTTEHLGHRLGCDGDGISIFASENVWVDHCSLARCSDGLIDVTHASSYVTLSNNYLTEHDKVMLLGHRDDFTADKDMKVTVAFNRFGPDLVQRMPRVRNGYAHVANNRYDQWIMYAIGGSANPTILSEGNYFLAPSDPTNKEVTKRETQEGPDYWKNWKWRSSKDVFMNGAYFSPSGWGSCAPAYTRPQSFTVAPGTMVPLLTADAGVLDCSTSKACK